MKRKDITDLLEDIGEGRYDCLMGINSAEKRNLLRGTYGKTLDIRRRHGESLTNPQLHERMFSPNMANLGEARELMDVLEFGDGMANYAEEIADLYYCAVRYKVKNRFKLARGVCKIGTALGFTEENIEDLCLVKYIERIMLGTKDPVKEKLRIGSYLRYIDYNAEHADCDEALELLEKFVDKNMHVKSARKNDPDTIVFD